MLVGPDAGLPKRRALLRRLHDGISLANWRHLDFSAIDLNHLDLAPDLAEDIGSRRWLRGMVTLAALIALGGVLWPGIALHAEPATSADMAVADELRGQALAPLARPQSVVRRLMPTAAVRPVSVAPERPHLQLTAVISGDDGLLRTLQRAGVSPEDSARAAERIAGAVPLGQIAAGTRIDFVLGPRPVAGAPRVLERLSMRPRIDMELALTRSNGDLAVATRAVAVDTTPLRFRGLVGTSLYRSARAAGAPPDAIQQYLQALDANIDLEADLRPDDSFDIIVAARRGPGGSESGQVLYAGLNRGNGAVVELMRWGAANQFVSADGLATPTTVETRVGGGSGMVMPVNGRITSNYGMRFHPILGYARLHAGVDIAAPWGTPVRASADGVVSFVGRHGGHGNYIRIENGGGLATGYAHLSRFAVGSGQRVRAGELIGYVGSTGLSTGPHLHYEMYRGGRTMNPLGARFDSVITTTVARIDAKELVAFKARLSQLKALRGGGSMAAAPVAIGGRTAIAALR